MSFWSMACHHYRQQTLLHEPGLLHERSLHVCPPCGSVSSHHYSQIGGHEYLCAINHAFGATCFDKCMWTCIFEPETLQSCQACQKGLGRH